MRQVCTVEIGTLSAPATALVPPSLSMSCGMVMAQRHTDFRKSTQAFFAGCVIYARDNLLHPKAVLNTSELLARLDAKGVRPGEIAKALGVNPSRVTEIRKGERSVKLDEAAKLVAAFGLESPPAPAKVTPLTGRVSQLLVEYVALELGCGLEEHRGRIDELTEDVRAFAEFVADPRVRDSIEAAETFFQAMRLRRPTPAKEARSGSDSEPAH